MKRLTFYTAAVTAALGFVLAPYLVFVYAPLEPKMGFIQKIFYFHVPCAWNMLLAAILSGVFGGVFLFSGRSDADRVSRVNAELALLFGTLVLITGPLWGKKAWGHYWVWDARLTTSLILVLTVAAAMLARRYTGTLGARLAAGVSLFAAANVPLVYLSVRLGRTNHPPNTVVSELAPQMRVALWSCVLCFSLLYGVLFCLRYRQERLRDDIEALVDRQLTSPARRS